MQDPGPVNLEAMIATISLPGDKWDVLDVPPWVHFANEHNAKVAADIFSVGPWRYFCEKYNAEKEIEPVHCPVGWDLVKYLAGRERDRERSQSTLSGVANVKNLIRSLFTTSCGQDFRRRRGGDRVPFTASPDVGIKNLHVMLIGKPLTFYLVFMILTFIIGQGMEGTSTYIALLVQHC
jgi:hypothetical protein